MFAEQVVEVVENGLHPVGKLFLFVAGEIPDVFAQRHNRARDEDPVVQVFALHEVQACR